MQAKNDKEPNNQRVLTLPKGSKLKRHQRCKGCPPQRRTLRGTRSDKCSGLCTPSPQVCLLRNYFFQVLDDAVLLTSPPPSNQTPGISADPTRSHMRSPRPRRSRLPVEPYSHPGALAMPPAGRPTRFPHCRPCGPTGPILDYAQIDHRPLSTIVRRTGCRSLHPAWQRPPRIPCQMCRWDRRRRSCRCCRRRQCRWPHRPSAAIAPHPCCCGWSHRRPAPWTWGRFPTRTDDHRRREVGHYISSASISAAGWSSMTAAALLPRIPSCWHREGTNYRMHLLLCGYRLHLWTKPLGISTAGKLTNSIVHGDRP